MLERFHHAHLRCDARGRRTDTHVRYGVRDRRLAVEIKRWEKSESFVLDAHYATEPAHTLANHYPECDLLPGGCYHDVGYLLGGTGGSILERYGREALYTWLAALHAEWLAETARG